ncbi:MAG: hypothetical protein HON53_15895 [Planctomycetaceae bacterium]|jgi:hypothetical protein|nr:hypothetical protein [Planctomycetaceae bacterium]MBT6157778.1 hypothetical protein [Planctomycetaceae bacterium]MBT6484540.1 hypothetical protein [Planctomycetaceae bacterium]MBT6492993.1 hypothetical protein [Planctomycetaceae bacterium]
MSRQSSRQDKPKAAATPDIYCGLLFVSVAALIGGIVFLVLELNKYDWQVAGG